jgi:hypothetical protein
MVSVELRADPEPLLATLNATVPVPIPPEALSVSQVWSDDAVHTQELELATTDMMLGPFSADPAAVYESDSGVTVNAQLDEVACATGMDCPATEIVPVSEVLPVLSAAVAVTDPLPVPPAEFNVSQPKSEEAVQAHVA